MAELRGFGFGPPRGTFVGTVPAFEIASALAIQETS